MFNLIAQNTLLVRDANGDYALAPSEVILEAARQVIDIKMQRGEMFRGTIDSASIHPREIVKEVLAHNAGALIMAHNHPSGHPEPSAADQNITQRLKDAPALVEVRVLDHIVVCGLQTVSFAEEGLI